MSNILSFGEVEIEKSKQGPILEKVSPDSLKSVSQDVKEKLKKECEEGTSKKAYNEILHVFNNFKTIDLTEYEQPVKMGVDVKIFGINSVNYINALSYYLLQMVEKYSSEVVFFSYFTSIDNNTSNIKHHYEFDFQCFALLVYKEYYSDVLKISKKETKSPEPYYFFNSEKNRWFMVSERLVQDTLKKNIDVLLKLLGFRQHTKKQTIPTVKEIITSIGTLYDDGQNALVEWTMDHPNLVQFKDTVYDIETRSIAKMNPSFLLCNYHDYRLPIKSVNLDELKVEDGFVPIEETIEELEEEAQLILERLSIISNEKEFLMTVFGNGFCHHNEFLTFPILEGGAGLGKSWFFGLLTKSLYNSENMSYTDQDDLNDNSSFVLSNMYRKEFNLIGELNGNFMSQTFINVIKTKMSDESEIKMKFRPSVNATVYAQVFSLSNKGQVPAIPDRFVNDDGLNRRVVRIICNKSNGKAIDSKKYSREALKEKIPHFALLSMLFLQKHRDNGNISEFTQVVSGASKYAIKGFTSEEMVDSTSSYFKQQDRKRRFFLSLYTTFIAMNKNSTEFNSLPLTARITKKEEEEDISGYDKLEKFKDWLESLTCGDVHKYFESFFKTNYQSSNMSKDKLVEYLELHGIVKGNRSYKGKRNNRYGKPFAEHVEQIMLEEKEGRLLLDEDIF